MDNHHFEQHKNFEKKKKIKLKRTFFWGGNFLSIFFDKKIGKFLEIYIILV